MSKIIDIKFISGKREEIFQSDEKAKNLMIKLANYEYNQYKNSEVYRLEKYSIEKWAHRIAADAEFKTYFRYIDSATIARFTSAGITLPETPAEISIEQKILQMLKDGWELKGDIIANDKTWVQTMVKYEKYDSSWVKKGS
jgi:hypothetical protein